MSYFLANSFWKKLWLAFQFVVQIKLSQLLQLYALVGELWHAGWYGGDDASLSTHVQASVFGTVRLIEPHS
jgi:hypothetical protein